MVRTAKIRFKLKNRVPMDFVFFVELPLNIIFINHFVRSVEERSLNSRRSREPIVMNRIEKMQIYHRANRWIFTVGQRKIEENWDLIIIK